MANPFGTGLEQLVINDKHPLANFLVAALIPRSGAKLYEPVTKQFIGVNWLENFSLDSEGFMRASGNTVGNAVVLPKVLFGNAPYTVVAVYRRDGSLNGEGYPQAGLQDSVYGYDRVFADQDTWANRHGLRLYNNPDIGGYITFAGSNNRVYQFARSSGTSSDAGYWEAVNSAPISGAPSSYYSGATPIASSYDNLIFNVAPSWAGHYTLAFDKQLSDAELTALFNDPGSLIKVAPRPAPMLTGEELGVGIDFVTTGSTTDVGTGTYTWDFTTLPAGDGLVIVWAGGGGSSDSSCYEASLSSDGPALQITPRLSFSNHHNSQFMAWPRISDPRQRLTLKFAKGTLPDGWQGKPHLFRVTGHDTQRMLGTNKDAVGANGTVDFVMEKPGSAMIWTRGEVSFPSGITGFWYPDQYTSGYANGNTRWCHDFDGGSFTATAPSGGCEIRKGEKQRRSRFITVREPWTTQGQPETVLEVDGEFWRQHAIDAVYAISHDNKIIRKAATEIVGSGVPGSVVNGRLVPLEAGAGNIPLVSPHVPLRPLDVYNKSTFTFYVDVVAHTYSYALNESRLFIFSSGSGNEVGILFKCNPTTYKLQVFFRVMSGYDSSELYYELPVGFSGVLAATFNANTWALYANGTPLSPTGTSGTNTSLSSTHVSLSTDASYTSAWGLTPPIRFAMLASSVHSEGLVNRISLNPWQIFKPRERRIFTGSPVLTHKRRRIL